MNTSIESLSIEIESEAKESTNSVDTLIAKLDKLRVSLQNVIKESSNFSKLKNNLESVSKNVSTKTSSPKTPYSDYGSYEQQLYKLDIGDLGDSKYAKLTSRISTANSEISKFVLNNNKVVTVSKQTKNGVEGVKVSVQDLGNKTKQTSSMWQLLTSEFTKSIAKIGGVYVGLKKLASKVADFVKEAADYEESLNLFTVTLGENAEQATEWVTKFSNALYLDPAGVMQYMGQFNSLTKGLGVGADNAYLMSKNLTQLTYDLASFKNLDIDTAFRKLQSAISGEIEPLRNVGVALSQATLQELALSLGIEKNVADMSEAEKAQLRYIQILRSTSDWQTDMARTLVTPANALRIIQQQFTLLARAIGTVFIPIIMEVIPYIMVLTKALTALAQRLADLLGYKIADIDYSQITSGLGGIADGIEDIGDNASGAAKKLNTMLAPFDKLNVVQNQKDKSGKGGAGDDISDTLAMLLPEYDALEGLNDKFATKMGEAEERLKAILPIVVALGAAFTAWKIGKTVANFMTWWDKLSGAGKTAARIGLSISLIALGLGLTFDGNKNVLDEETLLKGVAEQIGGATLSGLGAGLLTKNIYVGLFVGLSFLGFSGSKTASHGDVENGITGFMEQLISSAGITGLAFKLSGGNPLITLGVAATVTWANVSFDLAELAELEPTWEELYNAIFVELNPFVDLGNSIGDFVYDFGDSVDEMNQKAADGFTEIGNTIGDFIFDAKDWFDDLGKDTKQFGEDLKTDIGNAWNDLATKTSDKWDSIKESISNKLGDAKTNTDKTINDLKTSITTKWDNLKSTTSEKWESIKSTLSTKLTNIKDSASDTFEKMKSTISDKWTSAKNWLSTNIGSKTSWKEKFKNISNAAGDILDNLKNKFSNWKATLKIPHISWDSNGWKATGTLKKILSTLNLPTTLPKISVSWYEDGGFPRDGEFFFANENGPEMIGKIGNRSAVANNDQIETSLTNALLTALNSYDSSSRQSPTTIYIGNKKVYEGYGDHVNSENDRYGTNTIRI